MSTPESRYHVIQGGELKETFRKKKEAFHDAAHRALKENETSEVFDLMASKNSPNLWYFLPDGKVSLGYRT